MSINNLNKFLEEQGVQSIYFGAGARNSLLVDCFSDSNFETNFCFDEQSAAFKALGRAKITKKPVVVCTTSGTAVAQCYPAIIEAYYSKIPLIVISADRPARLRDSNAPQAINQIDIFSSYAPTQYCGNLQDFSIQDFTFPLHLNIEIETESNPINSFKRIDSKEFNVLFSNANFPIAVITEGEVDKSILLELDKLNIPFYIECTSEHKNYHSKNRVQFEKTILEQLKMEKSDLFLKFGNTPVTKVWRVLDGEYSHINVVSIGSDKVGLSHGMTLDKLPNELDTELNPKEYRQLPEKNLLSLIDSYPECELSTFFKISENIGKEDLVFVGNSMPIRYWQMIDQTPNQIYASRGANGIDGQISTAIGIANGTSQHVHCILGDITCLYDLNAFLMDIPRNFTLHVINNDGGRIFERIKVNQKMVMPHGLKLKELLTHSPFSNQIIEYFPDNEQTTHFWNKWSK